MDSVIRNATKDFPNVTKCKVEKTQNSEDLGLQKQDSTDIYSKTENLDNILEKKEASLKDFKHKKQENLPAERKLSSENIDDEIEIIIED